jgi:hypothetical protein
VPLLQAFHLLWVTQRVLVGQVWPRVIQLWSRQTIWLLWLFYLYFRAGSCFRWRDLVLKRNCFSLFFWFFLFLIFFRIFILVIFFGIFFFVPCIRLTLFVLWFRLILLVLWLRYIIFNLWLRFTLLIISCSWLLFLFNFCFFDFSLTLRLFVFDLRWLRLFGLFFGLCFLFLITLDLFLWRGLGRRSLLSLDWLFWMIFTWLFFKYFFV